MGLIQGTCTRREKTQDRVPGSQQDRKERIELSEPGTETEKRKCCFWGIFNIYFKNLLII